MIYISVNVIGISPEMELIPVSHSAKIVTRIPCATLQMEHINVIVNLVLLEMVHTVNQIVQIVTRMPRATLQMEHMNVNVHLVLLEMAQTVN